MKTALLSLFAGTVFLGGSLVASAGEPVKLTSTMLDSVTAGAVKKKPVHPKVTPVKVDVDQTIKQSIKNVKIDVDQEANAKAVVYGTGAATATAINTSEVTVQNVASNVIKVKK